jgi:hypothetical protein
LKPIFLICKELWNAIYPRFERHPDFVEILATKATSLLKPLFDGMIWRSHLAHDGLRRGNYYIKHLVVDSKGNFPDAMENLVSLQNPQMLGLASCCNSPLFFFKSTIVMG